RTRSLRLHRPAPPRSTLLSHPFRCAAVGRICRMEGGIGGRFRAVVAPPVPVPARLLSHLRAMRGPRRKAAVVALALTLAAGSACAGVSPPRTGAAPDTLAAADDGGILTPPMGWNSWNSIGLAVDEAKVRAEARALVTS